MKHWRLVIATFTISNKKLDLNERQDRQVNDGEMCGYVSILVIRNWN